MTPELPRLRRDFVKPGDIVRSSHGYDLLITEVDDSASVRSDDRHVGFTGWLHAQPGGHIRTERYPAASLIEIVAYEGSCRWFAGCIQPCTGTTPSPFGAIPTCDRCNRFAGGPPREAPGLGDLRRLL